MHVWSDGRHLRALEAVALSDLRSRPERVLEVARDVLDMQIAYFSKFTPDDQVIEATTGDVESFGFGAGTAIPLQTTFCRRMVAGQIPNLIANTRTHDAVKDLPPTSDADLGAYVGVPIQLSDGRIYGTLCCASHRAAERLGESDVRFLRILARLLADGLEREARQDPVAMSAGPGGVTARLSLWLAGAPRAAPAARQAIASLAEHMSDGTLYQLNLLVTELVTNSVRHSGIGPTSAVGLEVTVVPELIAAAVTDPGAGFAPEVTEPDLLDEGGRGLFLVDAIAARWGVGNGDGTRVWFELERELTRA